MNKYMTGQDVMKDPSASNISGFNHRVGGFLYCETFQHSHERTDQGRHAGWDFADKLIRAGEIFFIHEFHYLSCRGHAFPYGGTWACNACNRDHIDEPWWKIKVYKDGAAWCCVGEGFENLQESDNYAFGETWEAAIENYGRLMLRRTT